MIFGRSIILSTSGLVRGLFRGKVISHSTGTAGLEYLENMSDTTLLSDTVPCNYGGFCHRDIRDTVSGSNVLEKDRLPSDYLDQNIFMSLMPALEETLIKASSWNALRVQKCRFNGLDYIAEILWNDNPRRSKTFTPRLNVFNIPPFKEYLREHPRPYYPKSWLWSEDEAVLRLQRYIRGWLVRKREDVQEMRQFWKNIAGRTNIVRKTPCIVQYGGLLRKIPKDKEHEVTDKDVDHCEKYRELNNAYGSVSKK